MTCNCNTLDPYDAQAVNTRLIDKLIGTPYQIVKYVAAHMDHILEVGKAIGRNGPGSPLLTMRFFTIDGKLGDLGESIPFDIPGGVDPEKILNIILAVTATDGVRYFDENQYFFSYIQDSRLVVQLRSDAPQSLANADVRWCVSY